MMSVDIYKSINTDHINRMKDKSHTTVSLDAEKAFDEVEHPFKVKSQQAAYRRNISQHNKNHM